jgi:anti-anti-sigma factor
MNRSIQILESPSQLTDVTKDDFYQSVQLKAKTTADWIVVNLGNVDFIDSQGLGVLFAAHKVAALCHKELVLIAPQPSIYRELSVTGITKLIKIKFTILLRRSFRMRPAIHGPISAIVKINCQSSQKCFESISVKAYC